LEIFYGYLEMGLSNSSSGYSQNESIFVQIWFWMIVIGVILLIIAAIDYAARREARWWTWVLVGVGAGMVTLGIILGAFYANRRPSYPRYQQPQMMYRPGCATGTVTTAPPVQYVQPQMVQPMQVTSAVPQTIPTPGATVPVQTPSATTYGMPPHTVVTTSAQTPVRVTPTVQPGPAKVTVG